MATPLWKELEDLQKDITHMLHKKVDASEVLFVLLKVVIILKEKEREKHGY